MSDMSIERFRTDGTGWSIDFRHQWDSFTPDCNWRDFTLLNVGGEVSKLTGRAEFSLAILGLWLTVVYVYEETEFVKDIKQKRDDFVSHQPSTPSTPQETP